MRFVEIQFIKNFVFSKILNIRKLVSVSLTIPQGFSERCFSEKVEQVA